MELCKKEIKNFLYQSFPILARHPILNIFVPWIELAIQFQIFIMVYFVAIHKGTVTVQGNSVLRIDFFSWKNAVGFIQEIVGRTP